MEGMSAYKKRLQDLRCSSLGKKKMGEFNSYKIMCLWKEWIGRSFSLLIILEPGSPSETNWWETSDEKEVLLHMTHWSVEFVATGVVIVIMTY